MYTYGSYLLVVPVPYRGFVNKILDSKLWVTFLSQFDKSGIHFSLPKETRQFVN